MMELFDRLFAGFVCAAAIGATISCVLVAVGRFVFHLPENYLVDMAVPAPVLMGILGFKHHERFWNIGQ